MKVGSFLLCTNVGAVDSPEEKIQKRSSPPTTAASPEFGLPQRSSPPMRELSSELTFKKQPLAKKPDKTKNEKMTFLQMQKIDGTRDVVA
ncbi:hypothetical protein [Trichococcus alkaliphilus]|uniref:hypothetical protein n=1 Tax=Trichococcus alkaliphilus TaxID=2052943 RepID=UPI0012905E4B|nr:hypothetical protein [Trichococcus alkaliphilus]